MKSGKWSLGILNDPKTDEVPGSILLMPKSNQNEPLGLRNEPRGTPASAPFPYPPAVRPELRTRESKRSIQEKKRTPNGGIILEPQPDDSMNDPLNWPTWRRDVALLSLGFYCMLGGGMTPILAAGFKDVAQTYRVSIPEVALTTGLYMMGLGLGSVVASPTAILYGKRPVYLISSICYIISCVWCALSPNYISLVLARISMGFAVSPVECLPSATIAEIFFLHERAYRLGIYTLLLLSGKNLVPLISAAIIDGLSWRWVFWVVALIVAFCFVLVFFFVPETFWDRTPCPSRKGRRTSFGSISTIIRQLTPGGDRTAWLHQDDLPNGNQHVSGDVSAATQPDTPADFRMTESKITYHFGFFAEGDLNEKVVPPDTHVVVGSEPTPDPQSQSKRALNTAASAEISGDKRSHQSYQNTLSAKKPTKQEILDSSAPAEVSLNREAGGDGAEAKALNSHTPPRPPLLRAISGMSGLNGAQRYTKYLRNQPAKTFKQTLKPWNGKIRDENWFLVALRPFILFAYPAILWSTLVYSLSIGWLIVLSVSVSHVYQDEGSYNFSSLGTGLVYISPFVGGILGTAVAGKVSDIIVRFMSRHNEGIYEPEFRLVMAFPVAISTTIGLMGFGWSAEERDSWIVPTVFFGIISFGCALGSTTAITFAVDSYRQYAGEALVTLNFSKNIFHGLVFSLFVNHWLEADGPKRVFVAIGCIQMACLATTVPMYIYGKRARMWTVRRKFMEKF